MAACLAADSSGTDLPSGLAGVVHRHSEGNPLFMVAALDHMIERGTISHENGKWKFKVPLEEIELDVPETLRQMIEVQVEQLTAQEQRCLEAASITLTAFIACVNALAADLIRNNLRNCAKGISRRYRIVRPQGTRQFPDGTFAHMYEFARALYRRLSIAVCRRDVEPSCTDLLESVWRHCSQIVSVTWSQDLRVTSKKAATGVGQSSHTSAPNSTSSNP